MDRFYNLFFESLRGPLAHFLDLPKEAHTSMLMEESPLQDSFRFRARFLGLKIAIALIDETGELDQEKLLSLHRLIQEEPFLIGPKREGDALLYGHLQRCLKALLEDERIWKSIRKFFLPLCHRKAEIVIRETLFPSVIVKIEAVHIRRAALCAWLTFLRQATGSCFATAPALLIQQQHPLRFFSDLHDLLDTGQIKRVVMGKEYSIPFGLNPGVGDLLRKAPFLENSLVIAASLKEAGLFWSPALQQNIREMGPQSPKTLFQKLLLDDEGLTEEDLQEEEYLAKMRMTPLLISQSPVYYQAPSPRAKKVVDWSQRVEKACQEFRAITDCALLRTWEYTLASFADLKTEFTRWNLYISLGMHPEEKGGIGEFLYREIDGELQNTNQKIEALSREMEACQGSLQPLEVMFQGAMGATQRNQIKSEWMTQSLAVESLGKFRGELVSRGEALTRVFSSLIEQYDQKMQEYFQELFDPAISAEEAEIIDDSAAGFRLVYKHGRKDASQWTAIENADQYIDSLRDFFSTVERDLEVPEVLGREFLTGLSTRMIQFIQKPAFLTSSFERAKAKQRRSPWDYVSGGTLQILLASYSNRQRPFTEAKICPGSSAELLDFLQKVKKGRALLMHSPTHAFILYPDLLTDNLHKNLRKMEWDAFSQEHIVHTLSHRMIEEHKALFIHRFRQLPAAQTSLEFRLNLIHALDPTMKHKETVVDSCLYEQIPLLPREKAQEAIYQICEVLGGSGWSDLVEEWYGPLDLYNALKYAILHSSKNAFSHEDWDMKIAKAMRDLGYLPTPYLFGDTNWSSWFFGFLHHPITHELELWRLNRTATQGAPMSEWKQWQSPQNSSEWVILIEPNEYFFEF